VVEAKEVVLDRRRVEHVAVRVERLNGRHPPVRYHTLESCERREGQRLSTFAEGKLSAFRSQPKPLPDCPLTRTIAKQKLPSAFRKAAWGATACPRYDDDRVAIPKTALRRHRRCVASQRSGGLAAG
jgi:hypothetical protein